MVLGIGKIMMNHAILDDFGVVYGSLILKHTQVQVVTVCHQTQFRFLVIFGVLASGTWA